MRCWSWHHRHGDQLENCYQRAQVIIDRLASLDSHNSEDFIRWYETSKTGFQLHSTPLNIADKFRELVCEQGRAIIFTSATLAVSGNFTHYQQQLGLEDASTDVWPGPFNYAEQALFYLPQDLPEPGDTGTHREGCRTG